jgi:hypothetical protein
VAPFPSSQKNRAGASQRHPRLLFSTPLTLHHLGAGGIRISRGVSLDISQGGLGALVEATLTVGDTVEIDLQLPDYDLSAVGIVRHASGARSGFEFLGLTAEERQRIASLVGRA